MNSGLSILRKLILLVIISFKSHANSIMVIAFNEALPEFADLKEIQDGLENALNNEKVEIIIRDYDSWQNESSYSEKKDYIDSYEVQYSIELIYNSVTKQLIIKLKDWKAKDWNKRAKDIRYGRLNSYKTTGERTALGIEWSKEINYFINKNTLPRPEISIYEFIDEADVPNENANSLMEFVSSQLKFNYLNSDLSNCYRLKSGNLLDNNKRLHCLYSCEADLIKIKIIIEDQTGIIYNGVISHERIPPSWKFPEFINKFLDKMMTQITQLKCND